MDPVDLLKDEGELSFKVIAQPCEEKFAHDKEMGLIYRF